MFTWQPTKVPTAAVRMQRCARTYYVITLVGTLVRFEVGQYLYIPDKNTVDTQEMSLCSHTFFLHYLCVSFCRHFADQVLLSRLSPPPVNGICLRHQDTSLLHTPRPLVLT